MTAETPAVSLRGRVRLALADACRTTAEYARALVSTNADLHAQPGEWITAARRLRLHALTAVDTAVMLELAQGATWEQVAAALTMTVEQTQDRYLDHWRQWQQGIRPHCWPEVQGMPAPNAQIEPSARELDDWYRRTGGPEAPARAVSANLY